MPKESNSCGIKRFEFAEPGSKDKFVVFEGHEDHPFWNRDGQIAQVFTGLTFELAKSFAARGVVKQNEVSGCETYEEYLQACGRNS